MFGAQSILRSPVKLHAVERALAARGTHGDQLLAHLSPAEAAMLRARGGAGTRNPATGLLQFYDAQGATGGSASTGNNDTGMGDPGNAGLGNGVGGGGFFGGLRDFVRGGGLLGMAARGIGDALGPSEGVAGGYGGASGLGGVGQRAGDRGAGLLARFPGGAGSGGIAPMPQQPQPAPPALAPLMSTTPTTDLTGGRFGPLPAFATTPYQIGTTLAPPGGPATGGAPASGMFGSSPQQQMPQIFGQTVPVPMGMRGITDAALAQIQAAQTPGTPQYQWAQQRRQMYGGLLNQR